MLSRLLGVFALQYPVTQVWLCIITRSYHFNIMWRIMTTIILYHLWAVAASFFDPRFATFSNLCLINFYGHLMWGTHHHQQQIEEEKGQKGAS